MGTIFLGPQRVGSLHDADAQPAKYFLGARVPGSRFSAEILRVWAWGRRGVQRPDHATERRQTIASHRGRRRAGNIILFLKLIISISINFEVILLISAGGGGQRGLHTDPAGTAGWRVIARSIASTRARRGRCRWGSSPASSSRWFGRFGGRASSTAYLRARTACKSATAATHRRRSTLCEIIKLL